MPDDVPGDQQAVIDWLMDPATHGGAAPEHVQTHGAHVFLTGDEAWKIKRAVKYDTWISRRWSCGKPCCAASWT